MNADKRGLGKQLCYRRSSALIRAAQSDFFHSFRSVRHTHLAEHADAVRLAVGYVQYAVRKEQTVRTRELAGERVRLRPVSARSGAEHGGNDSGFQVHGPNRVTLGIR